MFPVSTANLLTHIRHRTLHKFCLVTYIYCKLRHLVIKENIERIYENACPQFVYGRFVILTRLSSEPDSLLSSEKPFSTTAFKIKFFVLETQH